MTNENDYITTLITLSFSFLIGPSKILTITQQLNDLQSSVQSGVQTIIEDQLANSSSSLLVHAMLLIWCP